MAGEEQNGRTEASASVTSDHSAPTESLTLGLVPAPELPKRLAEELAEELPELLGKRVEERSSWKVEVVTDPLTGGETDASGILDGTQKRMQHQGWQAAICLTDLPVLKDKGVVVAAASEELKVGMVSVPPLGVTLLHRRAREATLQLVSEMYRGTSESERDREGKRESTDGEEKNLRGQGPRKLIGRRLYERLAPIQRTTVTDEDEVVDVRFVSPGSPGRLRLLAGMVLSNRPWKLFLAMRTTLATAFATGAFVMLDPNIWQLGFSASWPRYATLTILSILSIVVWIIVAHKLWERPSQRESQRLAKLYNTATALTVSTAVLLAYVVLFVVLLVVSWVLIPGSFLQSSAGVQPTLGAYMTLSWVTTSLATLAGTLGSGLESDETVRNATFGHRQRQRFEQHGNASET